MRISDKQRQQLEALMNNDLGMSASAIAHELASFEQQTKQLNKNGPSLLHAFTVLEAATDATRQARSNPHKVFNAPDKTGAYKIIDAFLTQAKRRVENGDKSSDALADVLMQLFEAKELTFKVPVGKVKDYNERMRTVTKALRQDNVPGGDAPASTWCAYLSFAEKYQLRPDSTERRVSKVPPTANLQLGRLMSQQLKYKALQSKAESSKELYETTEYYNGLAQSKDLFDEDYAGEQFEKYALGPMGDREAITLKFDLLKLSGERRAQHKQDQSQCDALQKEIQQTVATIIREIKSGDFDTDTVKAFAAQASDSSSQHVLLSQAQQEVVALLRKDPEVEAILDRTASYQMG